MINYKRIALVAHDNKKKDLIEWLEFNWKSVIQHKLICTGTTGRLVEAAFMKKLEGEENSTLGFDITRLKSGPLGGDQQLGALITDGHIDIIIFLWDPMEPQPHDVDVKALLRIAMVYNVPTACNRSTADYLISSSLMNEKYTPIEKDYSDYVHRGLME
jgi:methylglyoxal synthase